jgi:tetratricopeptide (TPR) repeat protein
VAIVLMAPVVAVASPLGSIDFPVTGPEEARTHFLRGMLAMHSFWYEEAREEFQASTRASPGFAMGYWGEALTHYHPIWTEEDLAASRAAMAKVPAEAKLSERERAYLDAVRVLFGEGDRKTRFAGWARALGALHGRFPADDEATTLYSVALLGVGYGERYEGHTSDLGTFVRAGALSLDVMARNPNHPGAPHYVIHAFDDPQHAILALPAARRYAQIAPEASHARHMPSHIFVQLGMWPEATRSNEAAWEASVSWQQQKKLDPKAHDFHSLSWLQSMYLEQGQHGRAAEVLGRARADLAASKDGRPWVRLRYAQMVADHLLETEAWAKTDELLAPLAAADAPSTVLPKAPAGPTCHPVADRAAKAARLEQLTVAAIRGFAALDRKSAADALRAAALVSTGAAKLDDPEERDALRMSALDLEGRAAALQGRAKVALAKLQEAIVLDDRRPPLGPVQGVSPRERLGELLLGQKKAREALAQFRRALELRPRRGRALLGAARAAAALKDPAAAGYWSELAAVWADADASHPGVDEARRSTTAAR